MNEISVILIWLTTLVTLAIFIGECSYRSTQKNKKVRKQKIKELDLVEDIDMDFTELSIEQTEDGFVSLVTLSRRGSWRIAQNQVMGKISFEKLRDIEYSKSL